jgi:glycosyltransferase involved in cell wall biosynthesis
MKKLSIVIPVYNSESILPVLVDELRKALLQIEYEVILVNDCSKDKSWSVMKELISKNNNLIGINLRINIGQDGAIMAGLNNTNGEFIIIMDDDLQHNPYDIKKLYTECENGFDVCFGQLQEKKQKWWKNIGSYVNDKASTILLDKPKDIYLSPFVAIRRSVIMEVIKYSGPYPYLPGLILRITKNITQIVVEHRSRYEGTSNYSLMKSINVIARVFTSFSIKPLRLAIFLGIFASIFGFVLSLYFLYDYFVRNNYVEGWTTIVLLLLIFGGLILLSLGIIGEYVGRIYLSINNKPQFVIRDIIDNK